MQRLKRSLRRNWRKDAVTVPSIDTWRSCARFFDAACATGNGSTREPTRRIRFLTQTQALALLKELPSHLRELATFGLATGLRAANITGLLWDQVDIARRLAWIHPDQAKARKAIAVPLNDMAMGVLGRCAGAHSEYVFTYRGKRIKQVSTKAWHRACKRAGITDFRFHDLRHTWASWHIQHGTPLFALQELGGWETERMVRRYAHLSAEHLVVYVRNSEIHGTFTAHPPLDALQHEPLTS